MERLARDSIQFFLFKCLVSFIFCFRGFFDDLALKIKDFILCQISTIKYHILAFSFNFLHFFSPQPVNLSESLEGVLLSMCEESSQLRAPLLKVLEVCLIYGLLDIF